MAMPYLAQSMARRVARPILSLVRESVSTMPSKASLATAASVPQLKDPPRALSLCDEFKFGLGTSALGLWDPSDPEPDRMIERTSLDGEETWCFPFDSVSKIGGGLELTITGEAAGARTGGACE